MVLGDDHDLPVGLRDAMRDAGLSHLVAASGQNVVLLATLVLLVGAGFGVPWSWRLGVALAAIGLYVPLAGGGPSIQRAGVMGAASLVAALAGRPPSRWYAVLLAAAITLTIDPRATTNVGWQLSFAAVLGLLVIVPRLRDQLVGGRVPLALAEAIATVIAATLATAPLIALTFGRTSLISLPANLLAAPLVAPVMWIGFVAAAAGQVSVGLGGTISQFAAVPLAAIVAIGQSAARLPGATVEVPPWLVCAVVTVLVAAVFSLRARALAPGLLLALVATGLALADRPDPVLSQPPGGRVSFLDVGQGDATLLQEGSHAVLVDSGPPGGPALARLRRLGIRRLDVLVVTHAQDDHDGGAAAVLGQFPVGIVLDGRDGVRSVDGERMARVAVRQGSRLVEPDRGQVVRAGRIRLRVLSPRREPAGLHAGSDPNDRAIVIEATVGGLRVLLTADAESDVLSSLQLGPTDVLKVSHHGSADQGLPSLLTRITPRIAVISAGRRNPFGHPTASTLAALHAVVPVVLRTDRDGTVVLEPRAGGIGVRRLR